MFAGEIDHCVIILGAILNLGEFWKYFFSAFYHLIKLGSEVQFCFNKLLIMACAVLII